MPEIDLPADGEKPYGNKLRTAISAVNDAVDAATLAIADGSAVTDSAVTALVANPDSDTRAEITSTVDAVGQASVNNPSSSWWNTLIAFLRNLFTRKGDVVYNLADYGEALGLPREGGLNVDYTAALQALVADLPSIPNGGSATVFFPPGQFNLQGGIDFFGTRTVHLRGSGERQTEIRFLSGSTVTGDLLRLRGDFSSIRDLSINGRVTVTPNAGDGLVLDGPRQSVQNVRITDTAGNGLSIGKGASALGWNLTNFVGNNNRGYGVRVFGTYASTDGIWLGGDVGFSGKSCVRLDSNSQNITLLHVWGAGCHSTTDNHGLYIASRRHIIVGLQSETNQGRGVYLSGSEGAEQTQFNAGRIWGNARQGMEVSSAPNVKVLGVAFERNGTANTGINSGAFAAIYNSGSSDLDIVGCSMWDDGAAIAASSGPTGALYTYAGRSAVITQAYNYAESTSGTNRIQWIGNTARASLVRSSAAPLLVYSPIFNSAANNMDTTGVQPTIESAASITIPQWADSVIVSGNVQITDIAAGGVTGQRKTLIFSNAAPGGISATATGVRLNGAFTPTNRGTITLMWSTAGSIWVEVSRTT